MGCSYWFECEKCGYRTKISGRTDEGRTVVVQTISCRQCRELFDAVVRARLPAKGIGLAGSGRPGLPGLGRRAGPRPPRFPMVLNRVAKEPGERHEWVEFPLQCPQSTLHEVRVWTVPGRCPRCGAFMEQNAEPFRIWE